MAETSSPLSPIHPTHPPTSTITPAPLGLSQQPPESQPNAAHVPEILVTNESKQVKKRTVAFSDEVPLPPASSGGLAPVPHLESISVSPESEKPSQIEQSQVLQGQPEDHHISAM